MRIDNARLADIEIIQHVLTQIELVFEVLRRRSFTLRFWHRFSFPLELDSARPPVTPCHSRFWPDRTQIPRHRSYERARASCKLRRAHARSCAQRAKPDARVFMHHKPLMIQGRTKDRQHGKRDEESSFRRSAETSTRGACAPESAIRTSYVRGATRLQPLRQRNRFGDDRAGHGY